MIKKEVTINVPILDVIYPIVKDIHDSILLPYYDDVFFESHIECTDYISISVIKRMVTDSSAIYNSNIDSSEFLIIKSIIVNSIPKYCHEYIEFKQVVGGV